MRQDLRTSNAGCRDEAPADGRFTVNLLTNHRVLKALPEWFAQIGRSPRPRYSARSA